jgi:hypothetical protein
MSIYRRLVLRFAMLFVLGFVTTVFAPPAKAFTCLSDCSDAWRACTDSCGWPSVDEGCQEACQVAYLECRNNC